MTGESKPERFTAFISATALLVGTFHLLIVAGVLVLSTMEIRIIHLALMMVILFAGQPRGVIPAVLAVVVSIYSLTRWQAIALSGGFRSSLGKLPRRFVVTSRILLNAWGMPKKFHTVVVAPDTRPPELWALAALPITITLISVHAHTVWLHSRMTFVP